MTHLPELCYTREPITDAVIQIRRGETGYYPVTQPGIDPDERNTVMGVTPAQKAAMIAGSMFGWNTPAADPAAYTAKGEIIRRTRSGERR